MFCATSQASAEFFFISTWLMVGFVSLLPVAIVTIPCCCGKAAAGHTHPLTAARSAPGCCDRGWLRCEHFRFRELQRSWASSSTAGAWPFWTCRWPANRGRWWWSWSACGSPPHLRSSARCLTDSSEYLFRWSTWTWRMTSWWFCPRSSCRVPSACRESSALSSAASRWPGHGRSWHRSCRERQGARPWSRSRPPWMGSSRTWWSRQCCWSGRWRLGVSSLSGCGLHLHSSPLLSLRTWWKQRKCVRSECRSRPEQ